MSDSRFVRPALHLNLNALSGVAPEPEPEPINASDVTMEYNGGAYAIDASNAEWFADDLTFVYRQNNVVVTPKDVGVYDVTVSREGVDDAPIKLNITPKKITYSGNLTAQSRPYDGTKDVEVAGLTLNGVLPGDQCTLDIVATFSNKNAADDIVVLADIALSGTRADQYELLSSRQITTTANITKRDITISGIIVNDKDYDGTTDATVDTSRVIYDGIIKGDTFKGDTLSVTASATFPSVNYGAQTIPVTIEALIDSTGNYQLAATGQQADAQAQIRRLPLTINIHQHEVQSGKTTAYEPLTYDLVGTLAPEQTAASVFRLAVDARIDNFDIGDAIFHTPGAYDIVGVTLNNNYDITFIGGTGAYVVYESAPIDADNTIVTYNGKPQTAIKDYEPQDGDIVTYDGESVAPRNVGTYDVLIVRASQNQFKAVKLTIQAKTITFDGEIKAEDKEYDGTPNTTIQSSLKLKDGAVETDADGIIDDVRLQITCVFTVVTAGEHRPISVKLELDGADRGNYVLTGDTEQTIYANIEQRLLVVNIDSQTSAYGEDIITNLTATDDGHYALEHGAADVYRLSTTAVKDVPGTYHIVGEVLNPNYQVDFRGGENAYTVMAADDDEPGENEPEQPEEKDPEVTEPEQPEQPGEKDPEESEPEQPEEKDPEVTEPEQPEQPEEKDPEESEPNETEPAEKEPEESEPNQTEPEGQQPEDNEQNQNQDQTENGAIGGTNGGQTGPDNPGSSETYVPDSGGNNNENGKYLLIALLGALGIGAMGGMAFAIILLTSRRTRQI